MKKMNALKLNYKPSFDRFDFILNYLKNMNFVCKCIALEVNWFQRFEFVICTYPIQLVFRVKFPRGLRGLVSLRTP